MGEVKERRGLLGKEIGDRGWRGVGGGSRPEKILSSALWTPEHRSRSFKRCRREPLKYIGAREIAAAIKDSSFDISFPWKVPHGTQECKSCFKRLFSIRQCCYRMQIYFLNSNGDPCIFKSLLIVAAFSPASINNLYAELNASSF